MKANSVPRLKRHINVPLSCLAGLVDSGVISKEEARESVLAQSFVLLKPQVLLEALLTIRGLENGEEMLAQMKANLLDRFAAEKSPANPEKFKEENGLLIDEIIAEVTGENGPDTEYFWQKKNIFVKLNNDNAKEKKAE